MQDMKMLFSSRDRSQVEQVRQRLVSSGVSCEVRSVSADPSCQPQPAYLELWTRRSFDYHTASILFASPVKVLQQFGTSAPAGEPSR